MGDKISYVPVTVRWTENGEVKQRKIDVQSDCVVSFEQSNKIVDFSKNTGKPQRAVLDLEKEDAYNFLGLSHADENGYVQNGERVYVLDEKDIKAAEKETRSFVKDNLTDKHSARAGYGARVNEAFISTDGGFNVIHSDRKHMISVFMAKDKK